MSLIIIIWTQIHIITTTPANREAAHAKYIFLKGLTKSGKDHEGLLNKQYATTRG
jgi:hypothetical protein